MAPQAPSRSRKLNTANGPVSSDALGRVLMHEHLVIGFGGWDGDTRCPAPTRREIIAECVDQVEELKAAGFGGLLDPCPNDLGRDVDILGEVAAKTGFNILFAVGLYNDHHGAPYWKLRFDNDRDATKYLTEMYVGEITDGVPGTGLKPAIIKVATSEAPFTPYERHVLNATAAAAIETGVPITTHTQGVDGDEQLRILTELGVPAHQIVIGHSCGSDDRAYHRRIVDGGAYIGFDRFGLTRLQPDEVRADCLTHLVECGRRNHVVISHDCVFHSRGMVVPERFAHLLKRSPLHFSREIEPLLRARGVTDEDLDVMLSENPRRYFEGAPIPASA